MRLKILGCSGARSRESNPTCFLLDNKILIDAGSVVNKLDGNSITNLEYLIITHSHFDHIADFPLLLDMLYWTMKKDFTIFSSEQTYDAMFSSVLNNKIWPDMVALSQSKEFKIKWVKFSDMEELNIPDYKITPIMVNHAVPTHGLIIEDGNAALAFSADTYKTDEIWDYCKSKSNLKAVIAGVSFPNDMDEIAQISKHLTPKIFFDSIQRFDRDTIQYYISHIKPLFKSDVLSDLKDLSINGRINILKDGDLIEID